MRNVFIFTCVLTGICLAGPKSAPTDVSVPEPILEEPPVQGRIIPEKPLEYTDVNLRAEGRCECREFDPEWYSDPAVFTTVIESCHYDYIRLRFDRVYEENGVKARASYLFRVTEDKVSLDSVTALFEEHGEQRIIIFKEQNQANLENIPGLSLNTMGAHYPSIQGLLPGGGLTKKGEIKGAIRQARDSFASTLMVLDTEQDKLLRFAFKIKGKEYSLDGLPGNVVKLSSNGSIGHGLSAGNVIPCSFALGYYNSLTAMLYMMQRQEKGAFLKGLKKEELAALERSIASWDNLFGPPPPESYGVFVPGKAGYLTGTGEAREGYVDIKALRVVIQYYLNKWVDQLEMVPGKVAQMKLWKDDGPWVRWRRGVGEWWEGVAVVPMGIIQR